MSAPPKRAAQTAKQSTTVTSSPDALRRGLPKGKSAEQDIADLVVEGTALNASSLRTWGSELFTGSDGQKVDLTALVVSVEGLADRVKAGNLADAEAMLIAQAAVLNTLFANLLSRANQSKYVENLDRFLRLAFKAQSQCRTTCETLAVLKNPPVFARQANISNGPQQVNNGPVLNAAPTRAAIQETAPSKLLEAHDERLDGEAPAGAGASDSAVAAVAALDGTTDARGEGASLPQRLPRRRSSEVPGTRKGTQRGDAHSA